MKNKKTPSIKRLIELLDISKEDAVKIKYLMQSDNDLTIDEILEEINSLLGFYGIEAIFGRWNKGIESGYYCSTQLLYCNSGDIYIPSVYYDCEKLKFFVSDYEIVYNMLKREKRIN